MNEYTSFRLCNLHKNKINKHCTLAVGKIDIFNPSLKKD